MNRGSQQRKRTPRSRVQVPAPRTASESAPALPLSAEARVGCANAAVWVLAMLSFGYSEAIAADGTTTVRPYGLVFVVPCWLLAYANRRRLAYGLAPVVVALVALILGVIEIISGWAPLPLPHVPG